MNINFLNGAWNESIGGPRFPARGNFSTFFLDVRSCGRMPCLSDVSLHCTPVAAAAACPSAPPPPALPQLLQRESGRPYWDVEGAPPAGYVPFKDETWIFTPE